MESSPPDRRIRGMSFREVSVENRLSVLDRTGNRTENRSSVLARNLDRRTVGMKKKETLIPGLSLFRRETPTGLSSLSYEPCVCLVVQGAKRVFFGKETCQYDAENYLMTSVHLPTMVQVVSASREKPCLGLRLTLDKKEIVSLIADTPFFLPRRKTSERAMVTGKVTPPLISAFQRLIDLEDTPEDIPVLAPLIRREIFYRLLADEQGERLCRIALEGTPAHQIARAIDWIRENYTRPLRIDVLADQIGMSRSTFHHHFRSVTALSPLQFQKHLRLQEARRRMLAERLDAATAAFEVGYESPSQFSREYRKLFGVPPKKDISLLRQGSAGFSS
ncbi:AraC family transcriptional regulator [Leptospirillum ferriphilum]|uniref:AraC family transcriptional regulator n=1 Tax=Leptospirillum ferriphilum TaxID=178606 RepID=UPI0006B2183F